MADSVSDTQVERLEELLPRIRRLLFSLDLSPELRLQLQDSVIEVETRIERLVAATCNQAPLRTAA